MLVDKTNPKISLEEYELMDKDSNCKMEYLDGYLVVSSNSSMAHNKIVNRINSSIDKYLKEDTYKSIVMENLEINLKDIFYNLEF